MYYVSIFLQRHSLLTFSGSDRYSLPTDTSLQIHTYLEGKEKARRDREGGDEGRKEGGKGETKRGKERKRDRLCQFCFGLGNFPSAISGHLPSVCPAHPFRFLYQYFCTLSFSPNTD